MKRPLPSRGVIRSIAFVPHPPLLVPELTGAAAPELEPLRGVCQQAVRALRAPHWHALAADEAGPAVVASGTGGTFRGYGVDVPVTLGAGASEAPAEALPLPLLVAGWLAGRAGATAGGELTVVGELVHPLTPTVDCLARGRELAAEPGERSLLVLADGARFHDVPGAGRVDERAASFDALVATALATADVDALAGLDADLAVELSVPGRAAWQVLAGAAGATRWTAGLLHTGAPYGVGYHVAVWQAGP